MSIKPSNFYRTGLAAGLLALETVMAQTVIPPSFKMPAGSVDTSKTGFAISIHQMEAARPSGNNLPDPVRQVRSELIDDFTGLPVENLVDTFWAGEDTKWVPNGSFTDARIFNEDGVINYNQDARNDPAAGQGRFQPDKPIPGIPGITGSTDNIAFEAVTFLELTAGTHSMVVNSDDGFVVKTGASPLDALGQVLGIFDGGRGAADTAFDFVVQEDGIYPFVLQWWEGGGGANVEWFTVVDGERVLINDTANAGAVKAYREATVSRPYIASIDPAPGAFGIPVEPAIEIKIEDGDAKVATSTVKLSVNGAEVNPTVNKSGSTTSVRYTPAQALPDSTDVSVVLTYGDGATPPNLVANRFSFLTERLPITLPPIRQDSTGLAVIEAENFDAKVDQGDHQWLFAKTPAGYTGPGSMYALPETVAVIGFPDALTSSPRLDYKVNFSKTGKHYLWVRGSDGGGNSIHAGIDDADPNGTGLDNIDNPGCCGPRAFGGTSWVWIGGTDGTPEGRSTFEVTTAGVHALHLWMREDGQIADKFLVTTDPNFAPTGDGPPESRRLGDSFKPVVSITSPAADATLPAGSPVAIAVNTTDEDGTVVKVEFFAGGKKIGESTSAPFGFQWTPTMERAYRIAARVTDNSGDTNESLPVTIAYGNVKNVIFYIDTDINESDQIMLDHMLNRFGFFVTVIDDDASLTEDSIGKDLLIMSSSVSSGDIGDKFTTVPVPILNWEEALHDNLLAAGDSGSNPDHHGTTGGQTQLEIVNADHPLAGGLPAGLVDVYTGPQTMSWGYPESNAQNAIVIATLAGDPVKVGIYAYEQGAPLFDGFSTAAERRVMYFLQNETGRVLNETGFHLFDSAVAWLLRLPPPEPPAPGGGEPATLAIARSGNSATLSWIGAGTLQEAEAVTGPWTDSGTQNNPQDVSLMGTAKFYRVRQ